MDHINKYRDTRVFSDPAFDNYLKTCCDFIINICKEVYDNVLQPLLGEAHITFPLKKSKRQNNHTEMVYVWKKNYNTPPNPTLALG